MPEAKPLSDWKTYTLGVLFAIVMSLSGIAYAGVLQRVSALETDRRDLVGVAQKIELQTAVMSANLAVLTKSQAETTAKIDQLVAIVLNDSKAYREALKKWEDSLRKK